MSESNGPRSVRSIPEPSVTSMSTSCAMCELSPRGARRATWSRKRRTCSAAACTRVSACGCARWRKIGLSSAAPPGAALPPSLGVEGPGSARSPLKMHSLNSCSRNSTTQRVTPRRFQAASVRKHVRYIDLGWEQGAYQGRTHLLLDKRRRLHSTQTWMPSHVRRAREMHTYPVQRTFQVARPANYKAA